MSHFTWRHPFASLKQIFDFFSNRARRLLSAYIQFKSSGFEPNLEIHVLGGLGDSIVATRWIKEFVRQLTPDIRIAFYSANPNQLAWLVNPVNQDVKFFGDAYLPTRPNTPRIQVGHQVQLSSGTIKIVQRYFIDPALALKFQLPQLDPKFNEQITPIIGRQISETAMKLGLRRNNYVFESTGLNFPGDSLAVETQTPSIPLPEKYVTIHNGYDENFFLINENSTKNYNDFQPIVDYIQNVLNIPVIQLGISKTSNPLEVSYDLLDKTNLREVAEILKNSALHLDVESGLVHLATSLGAKCLVIFGPTPWEYFGYPSNVNIFSSSCSPCWWLENDWMNTCHRSSQKFCCTKDISPLDVIKQIETIFC